MPSRITARVQERPTAVNEARDQLRLSRAPVAGMVLWPLVFLALDAARYGRWRRG